MAPCDAPAGVAELRRVRGRPHRLGEVQPLLAGELVEVVRRMRGPPFGHPGSVAVGRWPRRAVAHGAAHARGRRGPRPYNAAHAGARGQPTIHRAGTRAREGRRGRERGRVRRGDDGHRRGQRGHGRVPVPRRGARPRRRASPAAARAPWPGPRAGRSAVGRRARRDRPAARRPSARRDRCAAGARRAPDPPGPARRRRAGGGHGPGPGRATWPTPSDASRARSRRSSAGSVASRPSARSSSRSRTSTRPTPRPAGLRHVRRPDRARRTDLPRAHLPARPADPRAPLRENLAVIEAGLRPPVRIDLAPLARREIAGLIEGIDGERPSASIVVLVAERSAGSPLSSRSSSRRAASSATRRSRDRSPTSSSARLARRSPECRRVLRILAPAERPMDRNRLGARGRRARRRARWAHSRRARRPCRGAAPAASRRTSRPGSRGAGARVRARRCRRPAADPPRARRACRRHRPPARCSGPGIAPRSPWRSRTSRSVAAAHWRAAHRLAEARDASLGRRPDRDGRRGAAGRDRVARARARRCRRPRDGGPCRRCPMPRTSGAAGDGPRAMGPRRGRLDGDRPGRRGGRLRRDAADARGRVRRERARVPRRAARPAPRTRSSRHASAGTASPPGMPPARPRRCARRPASCPRQPSLARARILALLAQERMIAGAFSDSERAASRGPPRSRAASATTPSPRRSTR